MYCSQCGKEASGRFCWNCGAPLHAAADGAPPAPATAAVPATATAAAPEPVADPVAEPVANPVAAAQVDWRHEVDYETLLSMPEVRDRLARIVPPAARLSGEDFASSFGKILKTPVDVVPIMTVSRDVYARMGVHTGKTRSAHFTQPVGDRIVAVLCALARAGYKVEEVHQASDGCMLVCTVPSDMFSLAGQLVVSVRSGPAGATVEAATRIEGQLYDWGKSRRCLDQLFAGLDTPAL